MATQSYQASSNHTDQMQADNTAKMANDPHMKSRHDQMQQCMGDACSKDAAMGNSKKMG